MCLIGLWLQEDKGAAAKKQAQPAKEKPEYEDMEVPDHWLPLTLFLVSTSFRNLTYNATR